MFELAINLLLRCCNMYRKKSCNQLKVNTSSSWKAQSLSVKNCLNIYFEDNYIYIFPSVTCTLLKKTKDNLFHLVKQSGTTKLTKKKIQNFKNEKCRN